MKTFEFTNKERDSICQMFNGNHRAHDVMSSIEAIVSERINTEPETIKPYHEHGNSVASDRTESGQSAEDVLKGMYGNNTQYGYSFNSTIEAMRLHAAQVCADKDARITEQAAELRFRHDRIGELNFEIDRLNESLTVMLRKNDELLNSVRPEVVVPSEERMNDLAQAFDELPKTKESKDTWECAAFKKGSRMTLSELRRLNPALTFTELNHTEK